MIDRMEIDDDGRQRMSELVRAAMGWAGTTGPKLVGTGRVSKATIERVKKCDDVSDTMLRALGDVLGMPRDYLLYVGQGDVGRIKGTAGEDPDLVRWTLDHLFPAHRPSTGDRGHRAKKA